MHRNKVIKAANALKKGFLVVYPTDTLYGIGADVYNNEAVRDVFRVKKRSFSKPLSVAVADKKSIKKLAYVDETAEKLIDFFLPGCLTLVLKKKEGLPDLVTGGQSKVGIRIPENSFTLKLLEKISPITCTSANIHGMQTPSKIEDIKKMLSSKKIKFYIDEGSLSGDASTVVDISFNKVTILREGKIPKRDVLDVIQG